jgi:type I restriction enzyme, S subunit
MKKGWQTKQLGELCRFIDYRGKTPEKTASGLRLITAKNVKMGYLQENPMEFVAPESYDSWMTRGIPKMGDVLFTTEAPLANVAQLDTEEKVVFAQRIIVLQPAANNLDRTFLKYLLLSDVAQDRILDHGTGATVQGIKASLLKAIPIEFPPLAEQQRIVGLLDEAFEGLATAKANAEKNLQNARALFESHLQSVFTQRGPGWVEKKLGEISEFKNGLNYNKSSGGQTLPVVGVADFQDNYFVPLSELQSATIDGELADNYAIQPNDILTVRSNGSKHLVGRCMLVGDVDEVVSYSGFIIRIRFDAKTIFPQFLLHFMKCQVTRDILTAGGGGANINNINQEKLSTLLVPLPPYKTQIKLAAALDDMREETQRLARLYERKHAALEALKKSLLNQAFSGEL